MPLTKPIFLRKINYIPLLFIAFINFTFCFKYLNRISDYALPISIIYAGIFIFIPYIISLIKKEVFFYIVLLFILLFTIISVFLLYSIPVSILNVDRWSVITSFWNAWRNGEFPYMAKSHMNNAPGPFPVYFFIAFPFYYLNEIGCLSIVSVLLFILYVFRVCEREKAFLLIVVLLFSVTIFWEVVARSTIFSNSVFLFVYINSFFNAGNLKKRGFMYGIMGGLILSTRGLVIIPLLLTFAFLFVRAGKWKDMIITGAALFFSFTSTLIPFFFWNPKLFLKYNPITLQAGFLPFPVLFFFIITAFVLGIMAKTVYKAILFIGLILFFIVIAYFTYDTLRFDITSAYFGGISDISYSIFCLPFLLFCLFKPMEASSTLPV